MRLRHFILTFLVGTSVAAAEVLPEHLEFFEKNVRPVLTEHCYKCHADEKQKAELRLDSRAAIMKGSDTGPVVVPGDPDNSSLIKSVRHELDSKMPEKAPKLADEQIAALAEWVRMGLPWPENDKPKGLSKDDLVKNHWSFQPVGKPEPPPVQDPEKWARSPIDQFILARLEPSAIKPSPMASRYTLIRRATFDLTGLPPSAEEIDAFEKDADPTPLAFERVVDRLLQSPRYGERWGRHWLDVARYADHKGYVFNEGREYHFAYAYRDWVIKALNDDMPYDQFVIRQIAADHPESGALPEDIVAMGFLTLGRRFLNNQHDIIDDRIDVVSRGLMSLTVACARCHDHKFDPVSTKDYYSLYGVFASSQESRDPGKLPIVPGYTPTAEYEAERVKRLKDQNAFETRVQNEISNCLQLASGIYIPVSIEALNALDRIPGFLTVAFEDENTRLRGIVADAENLPGAPVRAYALTDKPNLFEPQVFIRGNPSRKGDKVPRKFIDFLGGQEPFKLGGGRLEMARSIMSRSNPLTSRVMANRVWAHHFGAGFVTTPGDFGAKGEPPSHPELLDWLATQFMEDGWSLKKLHRTIMLSSTWMQTSDQRTDVPEKDSDNKLFFRQNRNRLEWEPMRDSLLFVTGQLDQTFGGKAVQLTSYPLPKRRTIYGYIDRQNMPGVFRTFDFANPDTTNARRFVTTSPQQALYMMNHPFVIEQACALVNEPDIVAAPSEEAKVQALYRRVLSRAAQPSEVAMALEFIRSQGEGFTQLQEQALWQYGGGNYDPATKQTSFEPLAHYNGTHWRRNPESPGGEFGWVMLHASGGHPAIGKAAIRRFVAPRDMTVSVTGRLVRPDANGDGVIGRATSSSQGQVAEWVVPPNKGKEDKLNKWSVSTKIDGVALKRGEALDFIVEAGADQNCDSYSWSVMVRSDDGSAFNSQNQFRGPLKYPQIPGAWERYAQTLLQTNEFVFVD